MNDTAALARLQLLSDSLQTCRQGQMGPAALAHIWREHSQALPLPERFGQVLGGLLDRLEAGALFQEESCSFSQRDLLDGLQLWLDRARGRLDANAAD